MADIICRWRNGTPKTVVELVNALPHKKMPIQNFRRIMERKWKGFFHTPYQLACQLALYCESEDGNYYPRFDHDISDSEAESWLKKWFPKYYVPNPYTGKNGFNDIECPTYVLKALYDFVKNNGVCSYAEAFQHVFKENIRNNDDIVGNYINRYSKVLSFAKDGSLKITGSYEEVFGDMDRSNRKEFFDSFEKESNKGITKSKQKKFTPTQIIYYGVPGCGKSFEVNKIIDDELARYGVTNKDEHKVRCVFHPEYSNADFVGQIYPYVLPDNKGVEYRFKPGPFAEIVRRAYLNPDNPYYLIIEEINRGNAAAIFGEMFQLLDRIEPGDDSDKSTENTYEKGWSSYGVDNIDVNAYIRQNKTDKEDVITYAESVRYDDLINFKVNTAIRLPPNLSVYATMNTSDQNVFTMDNAFQRRFKSKMIRNNLDDSVQFNLQISDTGVCWGKFRDWINKKILAPETGLNKAEDKCLGGWFIKGEKKIDENGNVLNECKDFPRDEFAEKVLKYLWNDVFKRNAAEKIFIKEKVASLTKLIDLFESGVKFAAFENVFVLSEDDKNELLAQNSNS